MERAIVAAARGTGRARAVSGREGAWRLALHPTPTLRSPPGVSGGHWALGCHRVIVGERDGGGGPGTRRHCRGLQSHSQRTSVRATGSAAPPGKLTLAVRVSRVMQPAGRPDSRPPCASLLHHRCIALAPAQAFAAPPLRPSVPTWCSGPTRLSRASARVRAVSCPGPLLVAWDVPVWVAIPGPEERGSPGP